ncbi:histidine kinase [Burkholderiales bacterium JOSHI_001]|nr:histidine kinase [Burkholderiales bacterium JOSHI_001]
MQETSGTYIPSSPSAKKHRPSVHHRIEVALAQERARIARELHDELGSALTAAQLELAAIRRSSGPLDVETQGRIAHLAEVLARCMQAKRQVVQALWPQPDAGTHLTQALQALCHELGASLGLQIELDLSDALEVSLLPTGHIRTACRVVQEALTNVAKHAHTGQARVTARIEGHELHVSVQDPGRGFDPGALTGATRGLAGMRARVAELRGRLEWRSAPGEGAQVLAVLPLPGALR